MTVNKRLESVYEKVTEAHTQIQKNFKDINPVVGVSQKMRALNIPADAITIDCLRTQKRIILVLHDQQPEFVSYQLSFKDKDPDEQFEKIQDNDVTTDRIYSLIRDYFSVSA